MRGVYFERAGVPLRLETLPDPVPGAGEMVIKVHRCGICGSDVHLTQAHGLFPENSVLGHEYAGEVVALGREVDGFRIGDRITALPAAGCGACAPCAMGTPFLCVHGVAGNCGGFADYMRVAARTSVRLPQGLGMADGALVEPLSVGLHGVALARMRPGARVLVVGAGAIGLAVIYWARRLGAGRVVAMSRSDRRASMADTMGADAFVKSGPDEIEAVQEALGGAPEIVFEAIGVPGALGQSLGHVARDGKIVSLGFCIEPDTLAPALATFKGVSVIFSLAYTIGEFQFCVDTLDRGSVEPRLMISSVIPLEQVPSTIEAMRRGETGGQLKIHADPSL